MVVIVTKQQWFDNFNFLETFRNSPNTPSRLKLLEGRVHELVGRFCDTPPPPRDNVVGTGRLRSGRDNLAKVSSMAKGRCLIHLPSNTLKLDDKESFLGF